ncbi:MAG TPA: hypothetical protein VFS49_00455, partial [Croceibacterium sp.]|nr:hypothetical protein [Croceibacterium sp.]
MQSRLKGAAAPIAFITVFAAQPGFAQDAPVVVDPAVAAAEADEGGEAIIVTGSRISRSDLESTVPIASISGETFVQQGHTNVGDTLNEL